MAPKRQPAMVFACLLLGSAIQAQPAFAEKTFEVTRKASDVYSIQGNRNLLLTSRCEVHALLTPARLVREHDRNVLVFGQPELARCRLLDLVEPLGSPESRQSMRLTLEGEDWYNLDGTTQRLRTVGCQRLANREPAVLLRAADGSGVVEFASGNSCMADGVYVSALPAPDKR